MTRKRSIYFDNNATTPLHPEVRKEMIYAMDIYGNPSSLHSHGSDARDEIEKARKTIADFINAEPDEIIFTGSGSEGNNTILKSFKYYSIITSYIEHPCILETVNTFPNFHLIPVDNYGKIDLQLLDYSINHSSLFPFVSIMYANNEIGTIQDIKSISKICKDNSDQILFHTDAVQAFGKTPIDVKKLGIDCMTMSAHKIYGPKGIGAIYVKKGLNYISLIKGGHQEKGRRAGTENTIGIVGFGKAVEMRKIEMEDEFNRILVMKKTLIESISENIPNVKFNGDIENGMHNTINVSFEGCHSENILLFLDMNDISVSAGSACTSGDVDPSHVLLACGISKDEARSSIRISLGRENTMDDINYMMSILPKIIQDLRRRN